MINGEITIGRDKTCDIVLSEDCVYASQMHATMYMNGSQLMYQDNSRNGTMVNSVSVHNRAVPVSYGDSIMIAGDYPLNWNQIEYFFPRQGQPAQSSYQEPEQSYQQPVQDGYQQPAQNSYQQEQYAPQMPNNPMPNQDMASDYSRPAMSNIAYQWNSAVGTIIAGICIYTLAGVARGINGLFQAASGVMDFVSFMDDGDFDFGPNIFDILGYLLPLVIIVGYVLFLTSLSKFSDLQSSPADSQAVSKVKIGTIILIVAEVVSLIPLIGWLLALVAWIVGYVKILSGYGDLRNSQTFPEVARRGAGTLRSCTIWIMVGAILAAIPLIGIIGSPVNFIVKFVTFFIILSAWGTIRRSAPQNV